MTMKGCTSCKLYKWTVNIFYFTLQCNIFSTVCVTWLSNMILQFGENIRNDHLCFVVQYLQIRNALIFLNISCMCFFSICIIGHRKVQVILRCEANWKFNYLICYSLLLFIMNWKRRPCVDVNNTATYNSKAHLRGKVMSSELEPNM